MSAHLIAVNESFSKPALKRECHFLKMSANLRAENESVFKTALKINRLRKRSSKNVFNFDFSKTV